MRQQEGDLRALGHAAHPAQRPLSWHHRPVVMTLVATILGGAIWGGAVWCGRATAAPWHLVGFRRIDADPKNSFTLTDNDGPWLILAASFAGDGARREAHDLVIELRKEFHLPAYLHSRRFDFTGTVEGRGISANRTPKKMRYDKAGVFDEYAVLVGNFRSVDDPKLQKTLRQIKYARPTCLTGKKATTQRFAGLRHLHRMVNQDEKKHRKGPMGTAFACPNPLLPPEYFAPKGIDSFVLKMNKGVENSLLQCKGKYSVRVATFRGNIVLDQRKVQEIEQGGRMKSRLEEAAIRAHTLTKALRKQGVEAYEFHDRYESYVTVGSFDWVGRPRDDGKQEMNPSIVRVIQRFAPVRAPVGASRGQMVAGLQPRSLEGIPFDVQPWPVEVPRRSIATDYAWQ